MKILYYNWVDYLDAEKRGGGVSVYQKNLIQHLGEKPDLDVYFVSSGISHDPFDSTPRWERVKHGPKTDRTRRFEIVNSGVLSPGHHAFGSDAQIDHPATQAAFHDLIEREGPFDIVHFNNLEGIPASVVALKKRFPETKVVYTFHNYYPVCPQVNLWFQEKSNCVNYDDGRNCVGCLLENHDTQVIRQANATAYRMKKLGISPGTVSFDRLFGRGVRNSMRYLKASSKWSRNSRDVLKYAEQLEQEPPRSPGNPLQTIGRENLRFQRRREEVARILNENCDVMLCVSDRVAEVAAKFGIDKTLLRTSYIGSPQASMFQNTKPKPSLLNPDGTVTLGYLGYMRRDKGYYFLTKALSALSKKVAKRVNLVVAARRGEDEAMERLAFLGDRLNSVMYADGYTHDQLDTILSDVTVGVVPVLWEDNLPQVAIEMHARHIPLLTSNLGGAQELGNTPEMVFEAGNATSFRRKLIDILDGKIDPSTYWQNARPPVSMSDHEAQLIELYRELVATGATQPSLEQRSIT